MGSRAGRDSVPAGSPELSAALDDGPVDLSTGEPLLVAGRCRACGDVLFPLRARCPACASTDVERILQELETGKLSVGELADAVGSTQPNVSKHLKILQDEGLIARRKEGNAVYYSIADPSVFELCDVVCGSLKAEFAGRNAMFK